MSLDNPIIVTRDLTKSVEINGDSLAILRGISLEVKSGQTIALLGASGSGKSTLLGLLAGLDLPTSGEIWLNGLPFHQLNEEARAAARAADVGFIFQSFLLVPSLTALENVMLPAELAGVSDAKQKAQQWLAHVGLSERMSHFPSQLSGGEQQRVAIARAFISEPKILFADEPTGNLDTKNGDHIADLLFTLNREQGTTLVMVTHDLQLAQKCQTIMTMSAGEITQVQSQEQRHVG